MKSKYAGSFLLIEVMCRAINTLFLQKDPVCQLSEVKLLLESNLRLRPKNLSCFRWYLLKPLSMSKILWKLLFVLVCFYWNFLNEVEHPNIYFLFFIHFWWLGGWVQPKCQGRWIQFLEVIAPQDWGFESHIKFFLPWALRPPLLENLMLTFRGWWKQLIMINFVFSNTFD